jgi:magnesium transporter
MSQYKKIAKNIERLSFNVGSGNKKIYWVNIKSPKKQEIEYLRKKYGFKLRQLDWTSANSASRRPVIEKDDGYIFLILQFPVFNKNKVVAEEINFFIGSNYIITLHSNNIKNLNAFFNTCKKDEKEALPEGVSSPSGLLFQLLKKLISHSYTLIDRNRKEIDIVEDAIFNNQQRRATSKILYLRLDIINIRKIVQSHKNTLKKLMSYHKEFTGDQEIKKSYLNLIEHSKRVWEFSENQKEVIEALYDTNTSLLNHRLSEIMKTLTVFSVSVLPIALVSGIFGTNLTNGMPLTNMENGFWIAVAIMGAGSLAILLFFVKKRWL